MMMTSVSLKKKNTPDLSVSDTELKSNVQKGGLEPLAQTHRLQPCACPHVPSFQCKIAINWQKVKQPESRIRKIYVMS